MMHEPRKPAIRLAGLVLRSSEAALFVVARYNNSMGQYIGKSMRWIIVGVSLLAVVGALGAAYEVNYRGKFYPGVTIGGEHVGGRFFGEVAAQLGERAGTLTTNGLTITLRGSKGTREVKVPAFAVGLTPDNFVSYFSLGAWEEVVLRAYAYGRSGSFTSRVAEQLAALRFKNFALTANMNTEAVQSLLSRELKNFFVKAVPAQFVWDGYSVTITPEKSGEKLSEEELMKTVQRRLASFDTGVLYARAVADTPAATAEKLEPFLKLANDVARSTRISFRYGTGRWIVAGRTLASWLTLKTDREIGIDRKKLEQFLSKTVAPLIDDPPRNSRFEMRDGMLVETVPGKSGNVVDVARTVERVEQIVYAVQKAYAAHNNLQLALLVALGEANKPIQTGTIEIPIEIIRADPQITKVAVDALGIKEQVGFAKTSFKGSSADRRHNIEVGVAKLNGILIAPGEEFSAVAAIGTTTEAEGFVKEFVIKENRSVKELGGGLCQIATTLFRMALNAGLPITERVNHRYVVSYYGPGLDATIYDPKPDFRFMNDTGNYLLLQGKVEGDEVFLELYGLRDGRSVMISVPELSDELPAPEAAYIPAPELPVGEIQCSETPRAGITADVTYTVRYADGGVNEQRFHSVYQPWQKICLVGLKL